MTKYKITPSKEEYSAIIGRPTATQIAQVLHDEGKSSLTLAYKEGLRKAVECVPLGMGKCNETGHDMITQYVDGFNYCREQILQAINKEINI